MRISRQKYPRAPKEHPRAPKNPQEPPRSTQELPRSSQGLLKKHVRSPKSPQGAPKEHRSSQGAPNFTRLLQIQLEPLVSARNAQNGQSQEMHKTDKTKKSTKRTKLRKRGHKVKGYTRQRHQTYNPQRHKTRFSLFALSPHLPSSKQIAGGSAEAGRRPLQ